ncbi:MAG TPA: ATP-binding protein [Rhodospirillales bacterium]|jgi:two-component system nitrogen regulation sensor histidine kinase GlnL|nr:ATP-binding protein [Rhodospirillales bacterium]
MEKTVVAFDSGPPLARVDMQEVLNALAMAVLVIDGEGSLVHVNSTSEQFFKASASHLKGRPLSELLPADSPLFALISQVRKDANVVFEYGVALRTPHIDEHFVNIQAAPLAELPGGVVVALRERSIADKIDRQLTHRGAARSVTAMAAMLAHEVKNPLSGIRGGAQLLEASVSPQDRHLTRMICDEVDRICALVDRMEAFSDIGPPRRQAVNIHQVLNHVWRVAENGFGSHVRFVTDYDPSLPSVLGDRDQLVQVFLNLVKNAAEAVPEKGGEIVLASAYRQGVRFAVPGSGARVHLPLMVSVEDNGEGIPEELKGHLFDPFVTSKPQGKGLGLALVAKIINDHGGIIEFDQSRRTAFRVMLPRHNQTEQTESQ